MNTVDKSKYKQLARRLKEERNSAKEQLARRSAEQEQLKVEMAKLTQLVRDLRMQCTKLEEEMVEKEKEERGVQVGEDRGCRSSIPCRSSYCNPAKNVLDQRNSDDELKEQRALLLSGCSSLCQDFQLATPSILGPTPRLLDSGMLVQEEEERQEAIEELQASLMGQSSRRLACEVLHQAEETERRVSLSWSMVARKFRSRWSSELHSEETDDWDVVCTK